MVIKKKLYLFIILFFGVFGVHKLYSKGLQQGISFVFVYTGLLFFGGASIFLMLMDFVVVLLFKPSVNGYITIH